MHHILLRYQDILLQENGYSATAQFSSTYFWHALKTGNVLIDSCNKQNAVISIVGHVLENHLDCTPSSNFADRSFDKLAMAKFQLLLGKPDDTIFAADFNTAMQHLVELQQKISPGKPGQNLIVFE